MFVVIKYILPFSSSRFLLILQVIHEQIHSSVSRYNQMKDADDLVTSLYNFFVLYSIRVIPRQIQVTLLVLGLCTTPTVMITLSFDRNIKIKPSKTIIRFSWWPKEIKPQAIHTHDTMTKSTTYSRLESCAHFIAVL